MAGETKRVTEKDMEISGRKYRIKKMDARMATYMAFQLKSFMPGTNEAGEMIRGAQSGMGRREFFALQNDCLSACYHVEKAGEIPVLGNDGKFTNAELEQDAKTVILLTVHSLAFNVTDFFDGEFLTELGTTFSNMIPLNARM